jgi:hypothetical protein
LGEEPIIDEHIERRSRANMMPPAIGNKYRVARFQGHRYFGFQRLFKTGMFFEIRIV